MLGCVHTGSFGAAAPRDASGPGNGRSGRPWVADRAATEGAGLGLAGGQQEEQGCCGDGRRGHAGSEQHQHRAEAAGGAGRLAAEVEGAGEGLKEVGIGHWGHQAIV